jgi:hypothetical protein
MKWSNHKQSTDSYKKGDNVDIWCHPVSFLAQILWEEPPTLTFSQNQPFWTTALIWLPAASSIRAGQWWGDTEGNDCTAGRSNLWLRTVHSQDVGWSLMGGICPWLSWMWVTETWRWLKAPLCAAVNQLYRQHWQCQSAVKNFQAPGTSECTITPVYCQTAFNKIVDIFTILNSCGK